MHIEVDERLVVITSSHATSSPSPRTQPFGAEAFEANNGTFTVAGHGLLDHVVATLIH
jgi:hypothetical protein